MLIRPGSQLPSMREAMFTAPLGDDVFADDPSVNALRRNAIEQRLADLVHLGIKGSLVV